MAETISLAIHGGAGTVARAHFPEPLQARYLAALAECQAVGWRVLAGGGTALDAVQAAVAVLEDDPLFNAGKGSVLNADGHIECDAAIMAGDGRAGAVAGVRTVRNPVALARQLLDGGRALLLCGEGAERFADTVDVERVEESFFITEQRVKELADAKASDGVALDSVKFGTVGAVARDQFGHLAAATSTGGMSNKLPGRIGDTPVIGAGTFAKNGVCAVSCTGVGEVFIREVVAHEIAARVRYAGQSLEQAVHEMLHTVLKPLGGTGGIIAVGADGTVVADFNSQTLYRAWQSGEAAPEAAIF